MTKTLYNGYETHTRTSSSVEDGINSSRPNRSLCLPWVRSAFTRPSYPKPGAVILLYGASLWGLRVKIIMTKSLIVIGAGGHAKVLVDAMKLLGLTILGVIEKDQKIVKSQLLGIPIIGTDEELLQFSPESICLVNGLGSIRKTASRQRIYERFKDQGYSFAQVIHPGAIVSPDALLAEGVQVMAGAVINPGARIGENTIINTSTSVDHDCLIGCHTHVGPGATVCGDVHIGNSCHIASGATIIQGITIGERSLIAAGALVLRDVPPGSTVMGVPGRTR